MKKVIKTKNNFMYLRTFLNINLIYYDNISMSNFKMTLGKTIAFSIDDLKKELGMNENGDLMFGGEVLNSNLHYFPTVLHPVGTIVSLLYDNGVKTLVPYSWRYERKREYSSLRPFGVIIKVNGEKSVIKSSGIVDLSMKVTKMLKCGDKLFLKEGVVVSYYFSVKSKKCIGYVTEACEKSDHVQTVKAYVNFEAVC